MAREIEPNDLVIYFLNVGFGDNIIIEFPADKHGYHNYGLVDCKNGKKTIDFLDKLIAKNPSVEKKRLEFVCATHPHYDHISGISTVLNSDYRPHEFWDSGFRHNSQTYIKILQDVLQDDKGIIKMVRISSGMEWYFDKVRITALSPSVSLRNRYATYGIDINNASIVLRIEHFKDNVISRQQLEYEGDSSLEIERKAGSSVVILAGDAEFDSWACITQEYPMRERTSSHDPAIKKIVNYLSSAVVKVAHHGSMHSTCLDVYEKMHPKHAVISTKQERSTKKSDNNQLGRLTRYLFPHESATTALEECDVKVITTDGSYEEQYQDDGLTKKDKENAHEGTIVVVVPPGGYSRVWKLNDKVNDIPEVPKTFPTSD